MWSARALACVFLEILHRRRGRLRSMLLNLKFASIRGKLLGFRLRGCRG